MKKSMITLLSAGLFLVAACGPSAEEKAAEAKRIQDSIDAVVEQARLDSIAVAEEAQRIQDSITNALAEQARLDSIAAAEATKTKGKNKPKATPKKEEPKGTGVSKGGSEINTDGTTKTDDKPKVTKGGQPLK